MRSKLFLLLVMLQVCVFPAIGQKVDEAASRIQFKDSMAEVLLAVDSTSKNNANLSLELIDGEDKVRGSVAQVCQLKRGKNLCKVVIPVGDLVKEEDDNVFWMRLRYTIGETHGIVSLSELFKDAFELRASIPRSFSPGTNFRVRVRALHPYSKQAVKDVAIDGEMVIEVQTSDDDDEDELKLTAKGKTDGKGFVVLDFNVPEGTRIDDYDAEIKITGRKNGLVREIEEDTDEPDTRGGFFLTKDKPLYQPGQSFSARGVLMDHSNSVVPDYEVEMRIEDEEETVLFSKTVKTSEYGIAAISWQIPENAKLGTYTLTLESDDDDFDEFTMSFTVTRYDLPNFSVDAKADRSYYLPTDTNAAITVRADYLFGKAVKRGKVRLVEEKERKWNWEEQKYVAEEGAIIEGVTDADGKFIANLDIRPQLAEMNRQNWNRFVDVKFAAYFTDTDTNRTEQKRFDIRLTKEPIHVYFIRISDNNPALPFTGYFSTFYADGTPATCSVTVSGEGMIAVKTKTNDIAAGKFVMDISDDTFSDRYYDIKITATDKNGLTGTLDENIYLTDEEQIFFQTDKSIYAPGDIVNIDISSTMKSGLVYVDIAKGQEVLGSYSVNLKKGKASLQVPYNVRFKGPLAIAAYTDEQRYYGSAKTNYTRGIIFPEPQNLKLDAKFSKDIYKPNEDASLKFSVSDGRGKGTQSALGIAIFDKAVEERAKTDSEFGSNYFGKFYDLLGYSQGFGNITLKDLNDLDPTKPVKEEMQLAAEIMLFLTQYHPSLTYSSYNLKGAGRVYSEYFDKQVKPLTKALNDEFEKSGRHPFDENSLKTILREKGIDLEGMLDPWGNKYKPEFTVERNRLVVVLQSAGADKKHGTDDDLDIWSNGFKYFTPIGKYVDKVIRDHYVRTGKLMRDKATLAAALEKEGIDLNEIKDPWGRIYDVTFEIERRNGVLRVMSSGVNGKFEPGVRNSDDFPVWTNYTDYFIETENNLRNAVSEGVRKNGRKTPKDDAEFRKLLINEGYNLDNVRDIFGEPVYLRIETRSIYTDRSVIENGKEKITPIRQDLLAFHIKSKGADRAVSEDDFDLTTFTTDTFLTVRDVYGSKGTVTTMMYSGSRGAIRGTVTDVMGAAIPGVLVKANLEGVEGAIFSTETDDEGIFLLENLPSGKYTLVIDAANGFQGYKREEIAVRSMNLVELKISLEVGNVSAMVSVTSEADSVDQTSNASMSTVRSYAQKPVRIAEPPEQTSTPRLREYFPETLFWNPEVITDTKGKAEVKFKMADNITTWKMYSIASTKKGKIGIAEKEVTAFQPFFVDLEPPKFLTNGDEISLPVQIRNYTEKKQNVSVTMAKGDWFSFLGQDKQSIGVEKGDSANAIFGFKAEGPVKNGRQRVTAIAQGDSDAIEKPVTVRPDGEEIVKTDTRVFKEAQEFDVSFPANAIQKTQKAELKIYPNLFAHVTESVEGLLQRPYGCGEQTVSSTYPNVMVLKFGAGSAELKQKAMDYLQKGYERLTGYQAESGGFTYWGGKEEPDAALTAYALRFLHDADEFIEVDEKRVKRANDWLVKQQRADGSWTKKYYYETTEDRTRTKLFTSYVARTLAALPDTDKTVLQKALDYLKTRNAEIDEPYAMALYGLALLDAGKKQEAGEMAATLSKMAIEEGSGVYWKLETNTPFYGWGTAGRLETTALVLQLLIREGQASGANDPARDSLTSRATLFLLKNKDRYGVWYSTQTTINVLNAFLASLKKDAGGAAEIIQVSVNGGAPENIEIKPGQIEMLTIDLTGKLAPAENNVEIRNSSGSTVMAQIVREHYVEWKDSESTGVNVNQSRALRLEHKCDKASVKIMEEVTCTVNAERLAFKGYGMLLAEIGTPPGADVSRESLEKALNDDWSISKYDILPDRIVVYMWAKAGGTKFSYKFKPRYGINAQTPASGVYDYYNPEAKAVTAPLRFIAR